jgi:lysophospholipase L1-like esterase
MAVIYCFGDSITYGAWDIKNSGWVSRLRGYLDELQEKDQSLYFLSYNLGIPGETTDGLVKRFQTEYLARAKEDGEEESVFFFAFGANDSVFFKSTNEFRVSKDRFVSNLQKVIDSAKSNSKKIALVNIAPADEAVCAKNYGDRKLRLNKNVEAYNKLIENLAQINDCKLVDIYSAYISKSYKNLLSEDGLHPNEKGHQLIFEKVREVIDHLI